MSAERIKYIPEETLITFELQGALPIFRETYHSPQVGTVTLKGFFNQSAHIELEDGTRYRTLGPRKDKLYPTDLTYPVVHLPDKSAACYMRTPLNLPKGTMPRLRFTTLLDEQQYVFKQISPGRRGFELWDGVEMNRLVERETYSAKLIPNLTVLVPVPTLLILLFPWLDSQTVLYRRP
jgi:hypothetical protein